MALSWLVIACRGPRNAGSVCLIILQTFVSYQALVSFNENPDVYLWTKLPEDICETLTMTRNVNRQPKP